MLVESKKKTKFFNKKKFQKKKNFEILWRDLIDKLPLDNAKIRSKIYKSLSSKELSYIKQHISELLGLLPSTIDLNLLIDQAIEIILDNNQQLASDQYIITSSNYYLILLYLYDYFNYQEMFINIDIYGHGRLKLIDFHQAINYLHLHGIRVIDGLNIFKQFDTLSARTIDFQEFFKWASYLRINEYKLKKKFIENEQKKLKKKKKKKNFFLQQKKKKKKSI